MASSFKDLSQEDRLRLMRFACSFAWADLEIRPKERDLIRKLERQLHLTPEEVKQVDGWLEVPPPPEDVDPARIPREHRELFLKAARDMVTADGEIDPEEAESLDLLEQLLR
jgi:uncharacterized tellurite resistance protein B-like protein